MIAIVVAITISSASQSEEQQVPQTEVVFIASNAPTTQSYPVFEVESDYLEKYLNVSSQRMSETKWNLTFQLNETLAQQLRLCEQNLNGNSQAPCDVPSLRQQWVKDTNISLGEMINDLRELRAVIVQNLTPDVSVSSSTVDYLGGKFNLIVDFSSVEGRVKIGKHSLLLYLPTNTTTSATTGTMTELGAYTLLVEGAINQACYSSINTSDSTWCQSSSGTSTKDSFFVLNVTLPPNNGVNWVSIKTIGKTTGASDKCEITVYNYTSSTWRNRNVTAAACPSASDTTLTYNITTAAEKTNFIQNNRSMRIMSDLNGGSADTLSLNYIEVRVSFTAVVNFSTPTINVTDVFAGDTVNFSTSAMTSSGTLSNYSFEWNATGVSCTGGFQNVTNGSLSLASQSFSVSQLILAACAGKTISWRFFANNSDSTRNNTVTQSALVYSYGVLNVSYSSPTNNTSYNSSSRTFYDNASVVCTGVNAKCGIITATARYNSSGAPTASINTTVGNSPLYIVPSDCAQENATTKYACGASNLGTYIDDVADAFLNGSTSVIWRDGNTTTGIKTSISNSFLDLYVNYSNPGAVASATWITYGNTQNNFSVFDSCITGDVALHIQVDELSNQTSWQCYNYSSSSYDQLGITDGTSVYEESLVWRLTNSTRVSLTNLTSNLSYNVSWLVNYTSISADTRLIDVVFSSSYSQISSNSTEDRLIVMTAPTDSCSYTGGNWVVLGSDNCIVTTSYNLGLNNFTCRGAGTFTLNSAVIGNVTFRLFDSCTRYVNGGLFT